MRRGSESVSDPPRMRDKPTTHPERLNLIPAMWFGPTAPLLLHD
jgi:hypothetical protein